MISNEINSYGIELRRLTHDKIELVRRWRNDPKISQYMEYRQTITPEMQERWFQKVNTPQNLFYIINHKGKEIGLINIKDIENGVGEGGIFIWDDSALNSDISFRAHLALFDEFFSNTANTAIISHVLQDNRRAQRFTQYLGFRMAENQDDILNQLYRLERETYFNNKNRTRYINHFNNPKNDKSRKI
ncbi:MAG: GNAT family N-acetyltransferase [Muribaculum sp.]|nr:GNAT family N-acetyltransferase [Muribaculaceae bacterium]MCM1080128.1 GNAT family N-acetyltransferase [Muribaculum sp.]